MLKRLGLLSLVLICSACGKDSPTTPTTPAPPVVPTVSFTSDTAAPIANSYYLSADTSVAGEVRLILNANGFIPGVPIYKVRATLLYDPAVLTPTNTYSDGTWLSQGGALTVITSTSPSGQWVIRMDRPDSLPGVTGSGPVISKRFTVTTGVRNRTTALQWTDTDAYTASFGEGLAKAYGGSVTVN